MGLFKVSSLEFARSSFSDFLDSAIQGGAVEWLRPTLLWIEHYGTARFCIGIGFVELFIGFALVLGLAVRPAALVGMLYATALLLTTWHEVPGGPAMMQGSEHQFRFVFPAFVFLMLGIGHAGETWGLGALYHYHRSRAWERTPEDVARPAEVMAQGEEEIDEEEEPGSFEELLEQEERARARHNEEDFHDQQLRGFSRM